MQTRNDKIPTQSIQQDQGRGASLLGIWQMICQFQPSRRAVLIVLLWWLVILSASVLDITAGSSYPSVQSVLALLVAISTFLLLVGAMVAIFDLLLLVALSHHGAYQIRRQHPSNVPIYHHLLIGVTILFRPKRLSASMLWVISRLNKFNWLNNLQVDFYDDHPDQLTLIDAMPLPLQLPLKFESTRTLPPASEVTFSYATLPINRGTGCFSCAHLRIYSPLRLFRRAIVIETNTMASDSQLLSRESRSRDFSAHDVVDSRQDSHTIRVLADFTGLLNNHLAAILEHSAHQGIQARRQQGHGNDFLTLREYQIGDAMRQIDWKASSRLRKVMSKAYEVEDNQQLVFLLDCGEQMRHQDANPALNDIELPEPIPVQQSRVDAAVNLYAQSSYFDKVLRSRTN